MRLCSPSDLLLPLEEWSVSLPALSFAQATAVTGITGQRGIALLAAVAGGEGKEG